MWIILVWKNSQSIVCYGWVNLKHWMNTVYLQQPSMWILQGFDEFAVTTRLLSEFRVVVGCWLTDSKRNDLHVMWWLTLMNSSSWTDRARVVGGLPDVVAIQEGKVNNNIYHCVLLKTRRCLYHFSNPYYIQMHKYYYQQSFFIVHFLNFSPWTWLAMCGEIPYLRWAGRRTKRSWCLTTTTNSSSNTASLPASQSLPSPRRTLANTPFWSRTSTAQRPASSLSACITQRKKSPRRGIKAKGWRRAMIDPEKNPSLKLFTPAHAGDHERFKYMIYIAAFYCLLLCARLKSFGH